MISAFIPSPFLLPARRTAPCKPCATWTNSLVVVAGATGGVGRHVVSQLVQQIQPNQLPGFQITSVRALTRCKEKATLLPTHSNLDVFTISSLAEATSTELKKALTGAAVLIICVGTTAFPTSAWKDNNIPLQVDDIGVAKLISSLDTTTTKRVVYVSSIGTQRQTQFPFCILNLFGALDAKQKGEQHVKRAAQNYGFAYAILRCGRLIGGPHSNVGMIQSEESNHGVRVERGDTLTGDISRRIAAQAVVAACRWPSNADLDCSLVHHQDGLKDWDRLFSAVESRSAAVEV